METLLPSEVARLVLGYLEGENCEEAAKCFLNSSQHLSEYRLVAQKGKRYPTKVNGYSLKEVLEEYSLVHSIVQESLTSMIDQPNVGGNMIECLRFLVRACQPVQVHINLHPQQGQGCSSVSKSEVSDVSASFRPRSKKILPSESTSENLLGSSNPPLVFPQSLPDRLPTQISVPISNSNSVSASQSNNAQTSNRVAFYPMQSLQLTANSHSNHELTNGSLTDTKRQEDSRMVVHSEERGLHTDREISSQQVFHEENLNTYQEVSPSDTTQFPETPIASVKISHGICMTGIGSKDPSTQSLNQEFASLSKESMNINSEQGGKADFVKPEEPAQSFTVTKCHGSNIVILDSSIPQACLSSSIIMNMNSSQEEDIRKHQTKSFLTSPEKATVMEQISEKMIKSETMVSKLVENINRVWTPAKQPRNEDSQVLGENPQGLNETVHSILKETEEDPCFDQFLREFLQFDSDKRLSSNDSEEDPKDVLKCSKKKRRAPKKKAQGSVSKLKHLCENAVSNLSVDKGGSENNEFAMSGAITATPAKACGETDSMTPMTKLLKSITSPSDDLYLDPIQFAGLLDMPSSAIKTKDSDAPSTSTASTQLQQPQSLSGSDSSTNNVIQVSQPNGTTVSVPIVFCESNQQVAQYVNEKGVSTIFTGEIVIPHHGSYVPIVPKIQSGVPIPAACFGIHEVPEPKPKRKHCAKQVRTRGGRQAAGQMHTSSNEQSDPKNCATLYYAAGEKDEVSSTISYPSCPDLPILESDSEDIADAADSPNSNIEKNSRENILQNDNCDSRLLESKVAGSIAESKDEIDLKDEDSNMPLLNASTRNTPGLSRVERPNPKRMSFSTPRRRLSHIRALDFKTPPKDSDQSMRRANTSPKNMSINALSPHTSGKSNKPSVREGLFKAPSGSSRETGSKVKAHLFKSPEYLMNLSSGFRVPSTAATSTPGEKSPPPQLSGAWDKIGGVSLILESESDVSPVKHSQPSCKRKVLKSWDADLRSSLGDIEPDPVPSRKRKASAPPRAPAAHGKKETKKGKKSQVKMSKSISKEDKDKSQNSSSESAGEMAKILEQNLMEDSSGKVISPRKCSPSKINISCSPCKPSAGGITSVREDKSMTPPSKQCLAGEPGNDCVGQKRVDKPTEDNSINPRNSEEGIITASSDKSLSFVGNYDNPEDGLTLIANAAMLIREEARSSENVNEISDVCKNLSKEKKTPLTDPLAMLAVDKLRLQKATWAESISFETPVKDESVNIIPQTPHFANPGSASKEDTPRTKVIKALPFPLLQTSENSAGTPNLSVPPTPSIRTTPSVSPNCPPYFQPIQQSPLGSSSQQIGNLPSRTTKDTLENILVKECSRIEAGGMRENLNTCTPSSAENLGKLGRPGSSMDVYEVDENVEEFDIAEENTSGSEVASYNNSPRKIKLTKKESSSAHTPSFNDQEAENSGCARCQQYEPKPRSNKEVTSREWVDNVKKKDGYSGDEMDECVIISPHKKLPKDKDVVSRKATKSDLKGIEQNPVNCENNSSPQPAALVLEVSSRDTEKAQHIVQDSPKIYPESITPAIVPSPPDVSATLHLEESVPEASASLAAEDMPDDVKASLGSTSVVLPVKDKQTLLNTYGTTCQEKVANREKKEQMATDNESSGSSSDSSSDSDSETSSSSSEDEHTPVKKPVVPVVTSSIKNRIICISDKQLTQIESSEISEPTVSEAETVNVEERKCTKDSSTLTNVELKSLLESETMNPIESLSKSNSSFKSVGFITELEQKRQRTLKQLKNNTPNQCISRTPREKSVVPTVRNIKIPVSSNIPINISTTKVVEKSATKDLATIEELPKKRQSKSKSIQSGIEQQKQRKHEPGKEKNSSDGGKASDEEEFQLHLSGDEKEVSPHRLSDLDLVEMQLAALHKDDSKQGKTSPPPILMSCQTDKLKAEKSATGMKSDLSLKFPASNRVSSKAADAVIKTLMEKGFGHSLPRPPADKIKKLASDAGNAETQRAKKQLWISSTESQKELAPGNSQSSLIKKSNAISSTLEAEVLDYDETDVINKSISNNALDIRIFYRGVGCTKPKVDPVVLKHQRIHLEGINVHLSPSPLISLYSKTHKIHQNEAGSTSQRIPKSGDGRAENRSSRTDSSRRYDDLNDRETKSRYSWNRNSGDRVSRRHDEFRLKRNRSPSPRVKRNSDYGDMHHHSKDNHRNQDNHHLSRRDSYPRRHESNSVYDKRGSKSESRSVGQANRRSKVSGKADAEDGELTSSDSEEETKRRKPKSGEGKAIAERSMKNKTSVKTSMSPSRESHASRRISQPLNNKNRILLRPNPCYERVDPKNKGKSQPENLDRPVKAKHTDEDINDADLDSENFPVLGEEDAHQNDSKDSEQNSSVETSQNSKLPLRRAPPRQVNAHKLPSENQTPTQRGKRKLSTSPDVVSEDSCQSSLGSFTSDSKAARLSRHSKKVSLELDPVSKILKLNEEKAAERDIIKDLNVDMFLDKIHPPKSPKHS